MFVVHAAGSDILAGFGDADVADVSFKFFGEDSLDFKSISVPNDQRGPSAHLSSGCNSFCGIEVEAGDVIIVGSVNAHGVFLFIENDATASSMIYCFSLRVVAQIIASVITAIPVDIVYVEVDVWSFVLGPFAFGNWAHLLADFSPSIGCLELVSFSFFQSKLIVIFDLMVFNFFFSLLRHFLCEAKCLHPES